MSEGRAAATRLLLVRHGATAANLTRPYVLQGQTMNPPLAELGERQALAAAGALAECAVAAVYASPLLRAQATAQHIAQRHALPVTTVAALTEADIGLWEGLSWGEVRARWPAEHAAFEADAAGFGYLGGENFFAVRERVEAPLRRLADQHPGRVVVVVCHNVVNRVMLAHWAGIPLAYARRIPQDNAGINVVEMFPEQPDRAPRVRSINLADHLGGLLPDE